MTDPDRLSPVARRLLGIDRSPPPPHLAALGRAMAERTKITFKLFRRDFEAAGTVANAAFKAGEITHQDAADLFVDLGHALSLPLAERYLAAGQSLRIAEWLGARPGFGDLEWLGPRNRMVIDGLVGAGESALAVSLLRQHLKKAMTAARAQWRYAASASKAAAAGKPIPRAAETAIAQAPALLELVLLEIAECAPWIESHGAPSDRQILDEMRAEVTKTQLRFG